MTKTETILWPRGYLVISLIYRIHTNGGDSSSLINDLYSFTLALPSEMKREANVHFETAGKEAQGKHVAKVIQEAL